MGIALNILIVGMATAAGCCAGWWLGRDVNHASTGPAEHGDEQRRLQRELDVCRDKLRKAQENAARLQRESQQARQDVNDARESLEVVRRDATRTKDVIDQLQALAQRMAADVGTHSNVVQSVNLELGEGEQEANDVLAAIAKLIDANSKMQLQLETAEMKLQQQSQQLRDQIAEARTDALTGLANRRAFDEYLALVESMFKQQQRPACVMMVDVDDFKKLNDTHGHRAGDEALRNVAHTLQQQLAQDAMVFRYGGEEFAIIFAGAELRSIISAAERARVAVSKGFVMWEANKLQVTASAGLAEFRSGEAALDVLHRSDAALYASKQSGRDCAHWHDGQTTHRLPTSTALKATHTIARDALSGISTQQSFCESLERRLAEWRRGGAPLSALFVEIDNYADLVAEHGEAAGETILRATAQFLRASMRDMDHVARFDTHQFALLLPTARLCDAESIAERLRATIENCKLPSARGMLNFTISIALAEPIAGDVHHQILARLHGAIQSARRQGGNCIVSQNEEAASRD